MLQTFITFQSQQQVHAAVTAQRGMQSLADANLTGNASEPTAQTVDLALLDVQIRSKAASASISPARTTPCPPSPAI